MISIYALPFVSGDKIYKRLFVLAFVFCFAIVFLRAFTIPASDQIEGRPFLRGDGFSDVNTLSAVHYFYDFGFWKSKFRPIHQYKGNGDETGIVPYTHYPALPDVMIGAWASLIHSTQESCLRIFPIGISICWFFLIFSFLQILIQDSKAAFIGAISLVLSNYFLAWADNLHKHTLEEFFKWFFVYHLYVYYKYNRSVGRIVFLGVLAILIANTSFEPITYLAVTVVGFSIIFEKRIFTKIFSRETIFLGFCFVLGFILHIYLNKLYFGSWQLTKEDLWGAFLLRTNQCSEAASCGLKWQEYLQFPLVALNRFERYYLIPGFAGLYFFVLSIKKLRVGNPELKNILLVLCLTSFSWYLAMPQHAWVHHFVGKQTGLFYGIVVGVGGLEYFRKLKHTWANRQQIKLSTKIFHGFFVFYILAMALTQQVWVMQWKGGIGRL